MNKLFYGLLAYALISGSGELIPASQNTPFYASVTNCSSVATAMGHGATCRYVNVPSKLAS